MPRLIERIWLLLIAVVGAAACFVIMRPLVVVRPGYVGASLLAAADHGAQAWGWVLAGLLLVWLISVWASVGGGDGRFGWRRGHPLAMPVAMGLALLPLGLGRSVDGLARACSASGAAGPGWLIGEAVVWLMVWGLAMLAMAPARRAMGGGRWDWGLARLGAWLGGVWATAVFVIVAKLAVQLPDPGQAIGGCLLGGLLGGGVSGWASMKGWGGPADGRGDGPVLLAPMLGWLAAWLGTWGASGFADWDGVIEEAASGRWVGAGLILPIHAASIGVAGCAVGLAVGRRVVRASELPATV